MNRQNSGGDRHLIESEEELLELLGTPSRLAQEKVIGFIDEHVREFIGKSPFVVLSTSNVDGYCDASPRGDAPGFVMVLDEHRLVIPERPGNKRADSLRNILSNPKVGLIFMIPGLGETLRINGKAFLIKDEEILGRLEAKGKNPQPAIEVEVEECFIHCAKAILRSNLWQPETWSIKEDLLKASKILAAHVKTPDMTTEYIEKQLEESYTKRMY